MTKQPRPPLDALSPTKTSAALDALSPTKCHVEKKPNGNPKIVYRREEVAERSIYHTPQRMYAGI